MLGQPDGAGPISVGMLLLLAFTIGIGGSMAGAAGGPIVLDGPSLPEARKVLDLQGFFDDKTLRRAYMRAVKRHPPERDPEGFQVVRLAYKAAPPTRGSP